MRSMRSSFNWVQSLQLMVVAVLSFLLLSVEAISFEDFSDGLPADTCENLAKGGNCEKDGAKMQKICAKTCYDRIPDSIVIVPEDDEAIFSMTLHRWKDGSKIDMDDYYGTMCVIVTLGIACDDESEENEVSAAIDDIYAAVPNNMEIFIIPFAKSSSKNVDPSTCKSMDGAIGKNRKRMEILQLSSIEKGPNMHPMLKFFMKEVEMRIKKVKKVSAERQMPEVAQVLPSMNKLLVGDRMTFFLVNAEGARFDVFPNPNKSGNFEGKLTKRLKDAIQKDMVYYSGDEL